MRCSRRNPETDRKFFGFYVIRIYNKIDTNTATTTTTNNNSTNIYIALKYGLS